MTPSKRAISIEEHTRRLDAVNHARASVGLKGFILPPEEEEIAHYPLALHE